MPKTPRVPRMIASPARKTLDNASTTVGCECTATAARVVRLGEWKLRTAIRPQESGGDVHAVTRRAHAVRGRPSR